MKSTSFLVGFPSVQSYQKQVLPHVFLNSTLCIKKLSREMTDDCYACVPFSPSPPLPLFMNSDGESTLDWLADDSKEDICAGTQLSAADYCPHH